MSALDGLTVCITNFKRPEFLDRAIASCKAAGIRRLTIASVCPDKEVSEVILKQREGWLSFEVAVADYDIGCNNAWHVAAAVSQTKRVIVLHDDDVLRPEFGKVYEELISPTLDSRVGIASWRASHLHADGTTKLTDYYRGPTRQLSSNCLKQVVADRERCSLSPIVSVLDRDTVIAAAEECDEFLTKIPECCYRPGMLLGTEIVVYLRHIEKFSEWLYVDQILAHYGAHPGSGTIDAENRKKVDVLICGYNKAREHCEKNPK